MVDDALIPHDRKDVLLERIATALETIALELATPKEPAPTPLLQQMGYAPGVTVPTGPFPPIGGGQPPAPWVCPVHGSWKTVPAGVSQRTGKPYDSFIACPSAGCKEKPPRGFAQPAPARAVPPSEGIQGRELP